MTEDRRETNGALWALGTIVVLLAGCAADAPEPATTQLSVTGIDRLAFEPAEFAITAGEEVTLELRAGEAVDHDFVVEGAGDVGVTGDEGHGDQGHAVASGDLAVAHADPGQTVTGTFRIDEPGGYEVYCSVPGHREAGMVCHPHRRRRRLTIPHGPSG